MQAFPPPPDASACKAQRVLQPGVLPGAVAARLWRGDQLGRSAASIVPTGFAALDAELPGGGWPSGMLTELLQPQSSVAEWRLLGPALGRLAAVGHIVALVGPPKPPHPPGLGQAGIDPAHLLWLQADTPAERLWCTEQLTGCGGCAVVAWLPQARAEQIRRLQLVVQGTDNLLFVCRPAAAAQESSAAPLRLHLALGDGWDLRVRVFKRRGPSHDGALALRSVPGGLDALLLPRLQPQPWPAPDLVAPFFPAMPETADAVGGAVARPRAARGLVAH